MIKAVVIGGGAIAREHLSCLRLMEGVELSGLCDLSPVMAEATAEQFAVRRWYTDHREMFSEVNPDVVHVTTPPQSHVLLAGEALDAGAHVFVEKPITFEASELRFLKDKAAEQNRLLVEDHNYLFNESVQRVLGLIESGDFGEVVHVEVTIALDIVGEGSRYADRNLRHPTLDLPGGAIADFVTHMSYLLYAFVGRHNKVSVLWDKRKKDTPLPYDEMRAVIEAEKGTGSVVFSSHAQPDGFWVKAHGTKMRASMSLFEPFLMLERAGGPRPLLPVRNGLAAARAYRRSAIGGLWRKLSGKPMGCEGLWSLLDRFYGAVRNGGAAPIDMEQIEAVHALAHAVTDPENSR
ncbi:MAG: Gfo/Idh/MocA family protein [Planctomycetota bacterium]|jgi:predicted dehydrogenase